MLIQSELAKEVLNQALKYGASFAELYIERDNRNMAKILGSKVHQINSGIDFGLGLRLLYGTEVLYAYTNSTKKEDLMALLKNLAGQRGRQGLANSIQLNPLAQPAHRPTEITNFHHQLKEPLDYMMAVDKQARALSSKISQVDISMIERLQEVEIFNTEGTHVNDRRPYLRFMINTIVEDHGEQSTGYNAPGIMGDLGLYLSLHSPESLAEKSVKSALATLRADHCPAGKMPVVLSNAFGGVIFHEACGHLLETTSVQKKASVFHDKMGEMIASSVVNAVDDGTVKSSWGSVAFDDEGAVTQKTQLIKNGKLESFLVDRVGALKTGYAPTGSGRR